MPRPRGDIRERVLDAAEAEFSRLGVDGAALRSIARGAGTNIGMIYYYFPTKDDLFLGVIERHYHGILARLGQALNPELPFEARVERLYAALGQFTPPELSTIRLVLREALSSSDRRDRILARFATGHLPMIVSLVGSGMREGKFDRSLHPAIVLACLGGIGMFPQLAARFLAPSLAASGSTDLVPPGLGQDLDRLPALLTTIFLRAVGPAGDAPPTPAADGPTSPRTGESS